MVSRFLISVVPGDALPIYRQIVEQVKAAIASGLLSDGDRLPSHRDLAREILVAPLTVKRAYEVLAHEGLAITRRGTGTFVRSGAAGARRGAAAELEVRLGALVRHAQVLGVGERDLVRRVRDLFRATRKTGAAK